jgi:hypothetical protein
MTEIKNISLAFSCPEKLNEKLFCEKCSRKLIDFTSKTKEELEEEIKKSSGSTCGIFKPSQLSDQFLKYAVTTVIATAIAIPAPSKEKIRKHFKNKPTEIIMTEPVSVVYGNMVQIQAVPSVGFPEFYKMIHRHLIIPEGLTEKGTSYIEFAVDAKGQMKDVKLNKGYNKLADDEALKAISRLNIPFKPAKKKGLPVDSRLIIPILFEPEERRKRIPEEPEEE